MIRIGHAHLRHVPPRSLLAQLCGGASARLDHPLKDVTPPQLMLQSVSVILTIA